LKKQEELKRNEAELKRNEAELKRNEAELNRKNVEAKQQKERLVAENKQKDEARQKLLGKEVEREKKRQEQKEADAKVEKADAEAAVEKAALDAAIANIPPGLPDDKNNTWNNRIKQFKDVTEAYLFLKGQIESAKDLRLLTEKQSKLKLTISSLESIIDGIQEHESAHDAINAVIKGELIDESIVTIGKKYKLLMGACVDLFVQEPKINRLTTQFKEGGLYLDLFDPGNASLANGKYLPGNRISGSIKPAQGGISNVLQMRVWKLNDAAFEQQIELIAKAFQEKLPDLNKLAITEEGGKVEHVINI
jgi:multidrug efflux pump subunit AcrA (membrane-fusion protein)